MNYQQPPGWYPDPHGQGQRYWDGYQWTEHHSTAPSAAPPPPTKSNTGRNFLIASLAVLGVVIVGVVGCVALIGSSVDEGTNSSNEPRVEKDAKSGENGGGGGAESDKPDKPTAGVGDRLTLKGTSYLVTNVSTKKTIGDPELGGARANGRFVIVSLELTNRKDEPKTIAADNVRLIGGNGNQYTVSSDVLSGVPKPLVVLEELQPLSPTRVTAVYDVPRSAIKGSQLRVEDIFSGDTGTIDLGR